MGQKALTPVGTATNVTERLTGVMVDVVQHPYTKQENPIQIEVTEFFKEQTVVLHLLRRFGCPLCRSAAADIEELRPILAKHNIRLVGVGLAYLDLDNFVEGKFWKEEDLFVDEKKILYKALGLGQGSLTMLLNKEVREANAEAKKRNVGGNLKGDGMQLGGTYIIDKSGNVLFEEQQKKFGDHPTQESILTALGIDLSELKSESQ